MPVTKKYIKKVKESPKNITEKRRQNRINARKEQQRQQREQEQWRLRKPVIITPPNPLQLPQTGNTEITEINNPLPSCGTNLTINPDSREAGKGSYGMFFRPSYLVGNLEYCITDPNDNPYLIQPPTNYVTKIGITDNMEKEYNEYANMKIIDPTYLIHYPKPIMVQNTIFNFPIPTVCKDYFDTKHHILSQNTDYTFLVMNNGGNSLENILDASNALFFLEFENCKRMLKSFATIVQGTLMFAETGFMHYDVKPGNIVYDTDRQVTKFIDFGLTKNFETLLDERSNYKKSKTWFNYPIERAFITNYFWMRLQFILNGGDIKYQTIQDFVNFAFDPTPDDRYWHNVFSPFGDYPWHDEMLTQILGANELVEDYYVIHKMKYDFSNLLERIKENINSGEEFHIEFMRQYSQKVDLFGVGLTLLCMLSPMQPIFFQTGRKRIWEDFFNYALNLTNCNMFERYTPNDANQKYQELLPNLDTVIVIPVYRHYGGKIDIMRQQESLDTASPETIMQNIKQKQIPVSPPPFDKERLLEEIRRKMPDLTRLKMDNPERLEKYQESSKFTIGGRRRRKCKSRGKLRKTNWRKTFVRSILL